MAAQVRIEPWAEGDLDLLRRANAPGMMRHLGGPETEEQLLVRHERYLASGSEGGGGMFSIVLLPEGVPAGSIGYWEKSWRGGTVYETGWGVLPEFQGRGVAAAAGEAVIARAAAEKGRPRFLHAFPKVDNHPSNAICRKLGFTLVEECDAEYPPGHRIRCNDWRLELYAP